MEMETGTRGATRQSWSRESARAIYAEIKNAHPRAGEAKLLDLFCERASEDGDALRAICAYAQFNFEGAQEGYARRQAPTMYTPEEKQRRQETIIRASEIAVSQILLLNQEMPNGKRLRYCTREELAKFHGGYGRMVKKMKPGELVGAAFSEGQVRELMS